MKMFFIFSVMFLTLMELEALDPSKCKVKPPEVICLVQDNVPHSTWYVYDWASRSCEVTYWSDRCASPEVDSNIFTSEAICLSECSEY